jgi:putative DNA primase/helicase
MRARLVTANEGNAKVALDMSLLKSLSSSDLLSGAFLYEREFAFEPSHKLVIATNHRPEVEIDAAARRRVHLVPFDATFSGAQENKNLDAELRAEAPGIMHLFIRSCLDWQAGGLQAPQRVTEATKQLFSALDPMGRFASERLVEAEEFLTTEELLDAYSAFLRDIDEGVTHIDSQKLLGRLKELPGVKQVKRIAKDGKRHRGIFGRRLAPNTDEI